MSQVPPQDVSVEVIGAVKPHAHVHAHAGTPMRKAKLSLLRLSAGERIGGVLILLAGLWALVFWALH